jgi:hypothetical protein
MILTSDEWTSIKREDVIADLENDIGTDGKSAMSLRIKKMRESYYGKVTLAILYVAEPIPPVMGAFTQVADRLYMHNSTVRITSSESDYKIVRGATTEELRELVIAEEMSARRDVLRKEKQAKHDAEKTRLVMGIEGEIQLRTEDDLENETS